MEPSVEVEVDGGHVGQGQCALAAALVDLGFELLPGGGLGGRLGLDPAASAGARVGAGLLAGVPDAFGVLPFAAGAVGSTGLFPAVLACHGPHASSCFVCGRGQSLGQSFLAETGVHWRKSCTRDDAARGNGKAANPWESLGFAAFRVERTTGIEPA